MSDFSSGFGAEARKKRLNAFVSPDMEVDDRTYNMVLGGVVVYGLLVNVVICALVGDTLRYISPGLLLALYLIFGLAGIFIAYASSTPAISFLGYNLLVVPVGLVLSAVVESYGGIDSVYVLMAFADTCAITVLMVIAAMVYPRFFERIGGVLFVALLGLLIVSFVTSLLGFPSDGVIWLGVGIFSLYIGYDFWRSQQFPKTVDNAVDCALDIYLDIINLFIRLLQILGKDKNRR